MHTAIAMSPMTSSAGRVAAKATTTFTARIKVGCGPLESGPDLRLPGRATDSACEGPSGSRLFADQKERANKGAYPSHFGGPISSVVPGGLASRVPISAPPSPIAEPVRFREWHACCVLPW
jgi:hypothetical protein